MSDDKAPDAKLPGEQKTVDTHVEGADSAPGAGLEREDAQPDEALDAVALVPVGAHVIETRTGMWSGGSGDTSGYGRIVHTVEIPNEGLPSEGWYSGVVGRLLKLVPDALAHCVGNIRLGSVHRMAEADFDDCLRANLISAFHTLGGFVGALRSARRPGAARHRTAGQVRPAAGR